MIPQPPTNLVLEIPSQLGDLCPVGCRHCIHRNAPVSPELKLAPDQILGLIWQGHQLGIEFVNLYPHQGDLSLEPIKPTQEYFRYAQSLGLKTKTVTSGINPRALESYLPLLNKLALSVDALDKRTYLELRTASNYKGLIASLELLKQYRQSNEISLTALVMANRQTIDSIERRVAEIVALGLFDKIKLLEMLPIGGARRIENQALTQKSELNRLAMIKKRYQLQGVRVGVPLWRIENMHRGCRLGSKDFVIGPRGEMAGCTLLYYLSYLSGNIHTTTLAEAWQTTFAVFRDKVLRPVADICHICPFYQADLCWGGCLARGLIFGHEAEVRRSCGIQTAEEAHRLYQEYIHSIQQHAYEIYPRYTMTSQEVSALQKVPR